MAVASAVSQGAATTTTAPVTSTQADQYLYHKQVPQQLGGSIPGLPTGASAFKSGAAAGGDWAKGFAQGVSGAGRTPLRLADNLRTEMVKAKGIGSQGVQTLLKQFDRLPAGVKGATATAMLGMSQKLEAGGRVAKGTTLAMTNYMLSHYKTLSDKGGGEFRTLMQVGSAQAELLRKKVATSTGNAKAQALDQLHQLQTGAAKTFSKVVSDTDTKISAMAAGIQSGSTDAYNAATNAFAGLSSNIVKAMNAGLLAVQTGTKMIGQALNVELKAFGAPQIPLAGISASSLLQYEKWARTGVSGGTSSKTGSGIGGHGATVKARGGLIQIGRPGERGR